MTDTESIEEQVRAICLDMPGASERPSHGSPGFFAGKQFVMLWVDGHHGNRFPHLWFAAPPGAQESFMASDPDRYFRPPYLGSRGWVGMRLDGDVDWDDVAIQCEEAFRTVAPGRLIAQLDERS